MSSPPVLRTAADGAAPGRRPAPPGPPRRRRPSALTVIGLIFLVCGLTCLGYVGYQLLGTDVVSKKAFQQETEQLRSTWQHAAPAQSGQPTTPQADATRPAAVPGDAVALLRIPRFGANYEVPIVQGTTTSALAKGVGHYRDSAAPGAVGNFAIAGHRITHGQPFSRLLELNVGDTVVVETRTAIFTYRLDAAPRDLTVQADQGWVLGPVPGKPGTVPTEKLITLTTCQDLFHSPDRSVGFGTLVGTQQK